MSHPECLGRAWSCGVGIAQEIGFQVGQGMRREGYRDD
jgi:hypothetical protein